MVLARPTRPLEGTFTLRYCEIPWRKNEWNRLKSVSRFESSTLYLVTLDQKSHSGYSLDVSRSNCRMQQSQKIKYIMANASFHTLPPAFALAMKTFSIRLVVEADLCVRWSLDAAVGLSARHPCHTMKALLAQRLQHCRGINLLGGTCKEVVAFPNPQLSSSLKVVCGFATTIPTALSIISK